MIENYPTMERRFYRNKSKEIKAGFTTGLDIILKNKDIIRSILNDGFKQVIKIRQVLRPTVVYSKFWKCLILINT